MSALKESPPSVATTKNVYISQKLKQFPPSYIVTPGSKGMGNLIGDRLCTQVHGF